jgi:SHS2 domain-containing protein
VACQCNLGSRDFAWKHSVADVAMAPTVVRILEGLEARSAQAAVYDRTKDVFPIAPQRVAKAMPLNEMEVTAAEGLVACAAMSCAV